MSLLGLLDRKAGKLGDVGSVSLSFLVPNKIEQVAILKRDLKALLGGVFQDSGAGIEP